MAHLRYAYLFVAAHVSRLIKCTVTYVAISGTHAAEYEVSHGTFVVLVPLYVPTIPECTTLHTYTLFYVTDSICTALLTYRTTIYLYM